MRVDTVSYHNGPQGEAASPLQRRAKTRVAGQLDASSPARTPRAAADTELCLAPECRTRPR